LLFRIAVSWPAGPCIRKLSGSSRLFFLLSTPGDSLAWDVLRDPLSSTAILPWMYPILSKRPLWMDTDTGELTPSSWLGIVDDGRHWTRS
jgi:hypothetical protein